MVRGRGWGGGGGIEWGRGGQGRVVVGVGDVVGACGLSAKRVRDVDRGWAVMDRLWGDL